mmetsp:Transcript_90542/g.260873  ORF Transcript_90542/g.260873 Transcript_90542/m.260873 type:complete len:242 (-) Transcript_90542:200-925(-)
MVVLTSMSQFHEKIIFSCMGARALAMIVATVERSILSKNDEMRSSNSRTSKMSLTSSTKPMVSDIARSKVLLLSEDTRFSHTSATRLPCTTTGPMTAMTLAICFSAIMQRDWMISSARLASSSLLGLSRARIRSCTKAMLCFTSCSFRRVVAVSTTTRNCSWRRSARSPSSVPGGARAALACPASSGSPAASSANNACSFCGGGGCRQRHQKAIATAASKIAKAMPAKAKNKTADPSTLMP